jgi:hypothetical protein
MPSLATRQRRRASRAVGANCWDAPVAIQQRVDALCASTGYSGKYIAVTQTLGMGASATFRFTAPGAFCPKRMLIFTDGDIFVDFIGGIKSGLDEQILQPPHAVPTPGGFLLAEIFDINNTCCVPFCLPCICAPGVPYEILYQNNFAGSAEVTIVLLGDYLDIPPDQFSNYPPPPSPCCPPPSLQKFLPFGPINLLPHETRTITLTTPGQYCPHRLFLGASNSQFIQVTSIQSGLKEEIITGPIPSTLFTTDNKCCVIECFECLCAPGYPLKITFFNTDAEGAHIVKGTFVGCFVDACPGG